jgi:SAM-dependent methyltransferase
MEHLLHATAKAEARHFWFRGFRAFVMPLLRHATAGRSEVWLLDCGCGTGANVDLLGRFGRAFGFDLTEIGLGIGRQAGRTRLACATVTAAPFPSGRFDVVTSFDVLYALDDCTERAALAEMYRLLKPGGYTIINVAAMELLRGDHSILGHEIRRYSHDQLRARVTEAGFTIVHLTYTNFVLFFPLAIGRAWQRRRGLKHEDDAQLEITVPPAPVNALLTGALLIESLWLRWLRVPFGSSLLCLARKPDGGRT